MNCFFMHTYCSKNEYDIYIYDDRGEIVEIKSKISDIITFENIAQALKSIYEEKGYIRFENGMIPSCFR